MDGTCRFCENQSTGILFSKWVKPTFTDLDKVGRGDIVCNECLFYFDDQSTILAARVGKDGTSKMRNYSHFIKDGHWTPLSKGNKAEMQRLLLDGALPELAAIADSGQKHIVFRAVRNAPNSTTGWVQFEEKRIYLQQGELRKLLADIEYLYVTFSKSEIESGSYFGNRILQFGIERFLAAESAIKDKRGSALFLLAIFLAQKVDDGQSDDGAGAGLPANGNTNPDGNLARDTERIQVEIPDKHLGSVPKSNHQRDNNKQRGEIHQLGMF